MKDTSGVCLVFSCVLLVFLQKTFYQILSKMKSAGMPKLSRNLFTMLRFNERRPFRISLTLDSDIPSRLAASFCFKLFASILALIASVIKVETFRVADDRQIPIR